MSSQYASSRTLLAVFALAPDPAMGAHAFAAAVAAEAPDVVMLADAGAPAVLAGVWCLGEKVSFINENTPRAPTGPKNTRKPARLAILK